MLLVGRVKNPEPRTSDFSTDPDFSTDLLLTTAVLKSGSDCTKERKDKLAGVALAVKQIMKFRLIFSRMA